MVKHILRNRNGVTIMSEQSSTIISKVWGMCSPLRDDGVSYGDYLEQLTYLIFLKMSDEYSKPPYKKETGIPAGYTWADMNTLKMIILLISKKFI